MANKKDQKKKKPAKKVKTKSKTKPVAKAKVKVKAKPATKSVAKKTTSPATKSSGPVLFKFHPLDDRVLVAKDEAATKTAGGIFIPDTAADSPNRGTVISVGPGHKGKKGILRPTDVKPGQKIIFNKFSGNELKLADKDYVILRETDIIGIVEE